MQITVTKLFPSGCLELSAFVSGQLIRRRYFYFSRKDAVELFKQYIESLMSGKCSR